MTEYFVATDMRSRGTAFRIANSLATLLRRCFLLSLGLLTLGIIAIAQQPPAITTKAPETSDCSRRSIPITALRGPEKVELQASALRIKIGAVTPSILYLERENMAPRVIILLDTSGSMWSSFGPKWSSALIAANFALNAVPPTSPVALVTFSQETHAARFGSRDDARKALIALTKEKPKGRTALYSAVEQSLQLFGEERFGDSIYIVSDGGDDYGPDILRHAADALIQRGTRAFAFLIPDQPGDRTTPAERDGVPHLADFVAQTGGTLLRTETPARWVESKEGIAALNALRSQLQSPYRLEVQLTDTPRKFLKLQIESSDARFELAYPHRIGACSTLSAATRP